MSDNIVVFKTVYPRTIVYLWKATHICRHVSNKTDSFNNVFIPTADVKKTVADKFYSTFLLVIQRCRNFS